MITRYTSLIAVTLTLAGCGSDGPSSNDVRDLIEADQQRNMAMLGQIGGSQLSNTVQNNMPKLQDVEVVSCEELQESLYRCVVNMELTLKGETNRQTVTQNFALGSDGNWSVAQ